MHGELENLDPQGFRPNVGIVISNMFGDVLWARRVGGDNAWQFPQGGMQLNETPEEALYRELFEEVGLMPTSVKVLAVTRNWLRYRLPNSSDAIIRIRAFAGKSRSGIYFSWWGTRTRFQWTVPISLNSMHGAGLVTGTRLLKSLRSNRGFIVRHCVSSRQPYKLGTAKRSAHLGQLDDAGKPTIHIDCATGQV